MINLAILISGRGSNMEAILGAIASEKIKNVVPRVVISNKFTAAGLRTASEEFGIPTKVIPDAGLEGWNYDRHVEDVLSQYSVTSEDCLICLAGFMRIISPEFVRKYKMRIFNIHPSLLPSFPGLHAQRQAIEYGVKVSGCTVHFVEEGLDSGPILLQRAVSVLDSDTEESLSARILEQEHILYPKAIRLFCEGKIRFNGRKLLVDF
ncbi:MAG TPA: phosphoribosylglycinamide formyltransferase [Candidatus Nitrosopolaris sp.]